MLSKINRAAIEKLVAVLFILAWLSQIPYLFPHPFQRHEGIAKLSEEVVEIRDVLKEMAGIQDKRRPTSKLSGAKQVELQDQGAECYTPRRCET